MKPLKFLQEAMKTVLQTESVNPIGVIQAYYGVVAPKNYLLCDGSKFDKDEYPELFTLLGKSITPDLRKRLIEGAGENGFALGTYTDAGLPNITGSFRDNANVGGIGLNSGKGAFEVTGDGGGGRASYVEGSTAQKAIFSATAGEANIDGTLKSESEYHVYGKSDTVQPATIALNYIIRAKN